MRWWAGKELQMPVTRNQVVRLGLRSQTVLHIVALMELLLSSIAAIN